MSNNYVFRKVDEDTYIRYCPDSDTLTMVPAKDVGNIVPIDIPSSRPKLRMSQLSQIDGDRFRQLCLDAMIEFQIQACEIGLPEASTKYLASVAQLATTGMSKRLRMSMTGRVGRKTDLPMLYSKEIAAGVTPLTRAA